MGVPKGVWKKGGRRTRRRYGERSEQASCIMQSACHPPLSLLFLFFSNERTIVRFDHPPYGVFGFGGAGPIPTPKDFRKLALFPKDFRKLAPFPKDFRKLPPRLHSAPE